MATLVNQKLYCHFLVSLTMYFCVESWEISSSQEVTSSMADILDKQELALVKLSARIFQLSQQLKKRTQNLKDSDNLTNWLTTHSGHRYGSICEADYFPCDTMRSVQCVHKMMVCDGYKDCKNGADEGQICVLPFTRGDVFMGTNFHQYTCPGFEVTNRENWLHIVDMGYSPSFPTTLYVVVNETFEYYDNMRHEEGKHSVTYLATYSYMTKELTMHSYYGGSRMVFGPSLFIMGRMTFVPTTTATHMGYWGTEVEIRNNDTPCGHFYMNKVK